MCYRYIPDKSKALNTKRNLVEMLTIQIQLAREAKAYSNRVIFKASDRYKAVRDPLILLMLWMKLNIDQAGKIRANWSSLDAMIRAAWNGSMIEIDGVGKDTVHRFKLLSGGDIRFSSYGVTKA